MGFLIVRLNQTIDIITEVIQSSYKIYDLHKEIIYYLSFRFVSTFRTSIVYPAEFHYQLLENGLLHVYIYSIYFDKSQECQY